MNSLPAAIPERWQKYELHPPNFYSQYRTITEPYQMTKRSIRTTIKFLPPVGDTDIFPKSMQVVVSQTTLGVFLFDIN